MWHMVVVAQAAGGGEGGLFVQLLPFILIFAIFWFLIIRPQRKRHKEHQEYLGSLKKGDQVVTSGGLFGTVEKVDDHVISLRISRDTRVKVLRQKIEGSQEALKAEARDEEPDEGAEDDEEEKEAS
ncbi:MAG: preprotein translocase subunit YajC [Persicimonas sp.]